MVDYRGRIAIFTQVLVTTHETKVRTFSIMLARDADGAASHHPTATSPRLLPRAKDGWFERARVAAEKCRRAIKGFADAIARHRALL